ncbi:MAG: hypothetical protein M9941_18740 [Anaerolineae bacterium]|nr:hypothetical protein [Anaerolineae bacterium]MCO5199780.1 hypothetical protein [Anaerolineae bacterium]
MRLSLADIRPKILSACTTDAERDLLDRLLDRRAVPEYVWIAFIAHALDSHADQAQVLATAASFAAAELSVLVLDDLVDDGLTPDDTRAYAVGAAVAAAAALTLVAFNPELMRLTTEFVAEAVRSQAQQLQGVSVEGAAYWAEAQARIRPYYAFPFMMGAVVVGRNDLMAELNKLGEAFSHISIIHDDLQDLFEEADWESKQNLVIQYAFAQESEVDWEAVRRTGALDYACNLWLDSVLRFDDLWQSSPVADSTEIAHYWRDYLTNALPGLIYLSAEVDKSKVAAVRARLVQL